MLGSALEAQRNFIPVGRYSQIDSAFVIGGNGGVQIEFGKRNSALLVVNRDVQIIVCEQIALRFEPLTVSQDEHGWR